jgi:signal transduction histidine kinase/CheY-like chemotaxis protein
MAEKSGEAGAGDAGGDALRSLRQRVLHGALNVLAVAVPGISLVIIIASIHRQTFDSATMVLSAYTLTFPLLRLLHARLGFRISAIALMVLLALTAFFVEARGGVGVGNVLLNALVLLLGALFFGRLGAALGLLVVIALFVLAGVLVLTGSVPPITAYMWDPTNFTFWIRQITSLVLVGLAIAVTQVYVVERLATEARSFQGLAAREQQQRLALESSEREREYEREQRMRAQEALEESRRIEALARLAGGIAHDFNNSLTVIMGAAEAVTIAQSPQDAAASAREIMQASRRAAELTRQLLTLGRRQVSQPRAVPMAPLFERLRTAFCRVLSDDIVLDMEAPSEDLVAHLDATDLERALFNLVVNARDAMPRGGKLSIRGGWDSTAVDDAGSAKGRYVEVTVSDTGEGMSREILDHIFDPFFTTKSIGHGTGLGLATVYAFATGSGGSLRVESTLGAGSTFTLLLPASADGVVPSEAVLASSPSGKEVRAGTRVLVVEDDPEVRGNMVKTLVGEGFQVDQAADGDSAIALIEEQPGFSLLCIDGVMPGIATGEVIKRAQGRWPSLRVLLCSGYVHEDLLRRGVAAGRYAFLQKPFSAQDLLSAVREVTA